MTAQPNGSHRALGARVRNLRDFRGWSQSDLAGRLEIDSEDLEAIEQGGLDLTLSAIEDLAECFEVPVSDLLDGLQRL